MTHGRLRAPALAGVLAVIALVPSAAEATAGTDMDVAVPVGQAVEQSVVLDRSQAALGDQLTVDLVGWPAGPAQIELCGNAALGGTTDCDPLAATAAEVGADGTGHALLVVRAPPSPCPCVVRVSQAGHGATATVPLEIVGLPDAPALGERAIEPTRQLELVAVTIQSDEGAGALFGFDAGRRVDVTVRNTGNVALDGVTVTGTLTGRGASSQPIVGPPAFDLAPGAEAHVALGFKLPAPAVGDYRAHVRVEGGDEPLEFSIGTGHLPWGLVNACVVALGLFVVLAARRRQRSPEPNPNAKTNSLPSASEQRIDAGVS